MKSFIQLLLIAPFLSILQVGSAQEPNFSCSTEDPTYEEVVDYISSLNSLNKEGVLSLPNRSSEVYDIPIHLYIFKKSDGSHPDYDDTQEPIADFAKSLVLMNSEFHPRIIFYIYKIDVISDDVLHDAPSPATCKIRLEELGAFDDNAIPVYYTSNSIGGAGQASSSAGIKLQAPGADAGLAFHEFGHYFGLYHTNHRSFAGGFDDYCIALYPDNSPIFECNPYGDNGWPDCPGNNYGLCYGDFIEDTPVALGVLNPQDFDCEVPVKEFIDGIEYTYPQLYDNGMTNNFRHRNSFTDGQKQRIIDVLEIPSLGDGRIGGDLSFLIDEDVPTGVADLVNYFSSPIIKIDEINYCFDEQGHSYYTTPFSQLDFNIHGFRVPQNTIVPFIDHSIFLNNGIANKPDFFTFGTNWNRYTFEFSEEQSECAEISEDEVGYDLDLRDVSLMHQQILGTAEINSFAKISSDLNNSGNVSTIDLYILRLFLLQKIDEFPVPNWRYIPKYALETETFLNDFEINPFSAVWTYNNVDHSYLFDNEINQKSYLGSFTKIEPPSVYHTTHFTLRIEDELSSEVYPWSFVALKSGNVFSTDSSCANKFPGVKNLSIESGSTSMSHLKDERYAYDFKSNVSIRINAIQIELELDGFSSIQIIGSNKLNLSEDDYSYVNGVFRLLWINDKGDFIPFREGENVFTLSGVSNSSSVKKLVNENSSLNLDNLMIEDEELEKHNAPNNTFSYSLSGLKKLESTSFSSAIFSPNPFSSGNAKIVLLGEGSEIAVAANVEVELVGMSGKVVKFSTNLGKSNEVIIPSRILAKVSSGVIFYHLFIEGCVFTGKAIKL